MRLLTLPVLALILAGSGAAAPRPAVETPQQVVAHSAQITQAAGSARFVAGYPGDFTLSGVVDLGNDTAVLDNYEIDGTHSVYQRIPRHEAVVLGVPDKRWVETKNGGHFSLTSDPFVSDNQSFFGLLSRSDEVRALGNGVERGTPVRRYSARLGIEAFLAVNPATIEEQNTKGGKPELVHMRDYFENWFVWDKGGQRLELAIDSKGRIRRADLALPLEPLTVQLYDYGVRVDVSAPPANQVLASTRYEKLKSDYCSDPSRQTQPRPYPC